MTCEICGRGSCTRSFHSLSEQEEFDNPTSPEDKIEALESRVRELEAERDKLREAIDWVCGLDVEGWPPFHAFTAAGYRYRWRTVLREKLSAALKG